MPSFFETEETQSSEETSLWVEKYRPKRLENYIGNNRIKKKAGVWIENDDIPNLLLEGAAGGGKSSLAQILTSKIDCDDIYINASDENSVDTIRNRVKSFASSVAMSNLKVIVLDEFDYMSRNAQAALRRLMEDYSDTTRFILTCVLGDTKIYSEEGYKRARNISDGDNILTTSGPNAVRHNKKTKRGSIVKISTEHGKKIEVTSDHLMKGGEEMKKADLFSDGDILQHDLSSVFGSEFELSTGKSSELIDEEDFKSFLWSKNIPNSENVSKILDFYRTRIRPQEVKFFENVFVGDSEAKDIHEIMDRHNEDLKKHRYNDMLGRLKNRGYIEKPTRYTYKNSGQIKWKKTPWKFADDMDMEFSRMQYIRKNYGVLDTDEDIIDSLSEIVKETNTDDYGKVASLGRLIGFMFGDGHIMKTRTGIQVSSETEECLENVLDDIERVFNRRPDIEHNGPEDSNGVCFWIHDQAIALFFEYLGVPVGNKVRQPLSLPQIVKRNKLVAKGFLQGFFDADATAPKIEKNGMTVRPIVLRQHKARWLVKQGKTKFFPELSHLLKSKFGIENEYGYRKVNVGEGSYEDDSDIRKLCCKLGVYTVDDKKRFLERIGLKYEPDKFRPDILGYLQWKSEKWDGYNNFLKFEEWKNKYDYKNGKIKDVVDSTTKETGEYIVYDPCMKDNHLYYSNGFISHNCNFKNKILGAIDSRTQTLHVEPPEKAEVATHLANILSGEDVNFNPSQVKKLVDQYHPDIRNVINTAQLNSRDGKLKLDEATLAEANFERELVELLKSSKSVDRKFKAIRQLIQDSDVSRYEQIYRYLYDHVDDYAKGSVADAMIAISEAQHRDAQVVDKEINFMHLIIDIIQITT